MPLRIVRNDITRIKCNAIVNAANESLLGGGGVDGAIHRAAGSELLSECRTLGGCKTGQAKVTKGYNLPSEYIIHTVGPVWHGGDKNEEELLALCYRNSLEKAKEYGCEDIAFPLISTGAYGFPKDKAFAIAVREISSFLLKNEMLVYIVLFGNEHFTLSGKLYSGINEYINDNYVSETYDPNRRHNHNSMPRCAFSYAAEPAPEAIPEVFADQSLPLMKAAAEDSICEEEKDSFSLSLDEKLSQIDESFSQMLLRKIDEKGITDAQCYKKANIDRKLFSKIRSNPLYKPSKPTVLALAISLEMTLAETKDMLMKAGFALSRSSKADIIVEYFIENKIYDVLKINEALFDFDQPSLC